MGDMVRLHHPVALAAQSTLIAIDAPGSTDDVAFSLDALGRYATRGVNSVTDTYGYVGTSETVGILVGSTTRISALDSDGSRVATKDGSTGAYLVADLHGNIAAAEASGSTGVVDSIRYDGYGQTVDTYTATGSITLDTKYQGRLDLSATDDPLYDMSARMYAPVLGTFSSLDSVMGSAQNPASMNRFLYAEANPTTFTDPSGHRVCEAYCGESSPKESEVRHERAVAVSAGQRRHRYQTEATKDDDSRTSGGSSPTKTIATVEVRDSHWVGAYPTSGGPTLQDLLGGVGAAAGGVAAGAWDFGVGAVEGAIDTAACINPLRVSGCAAADLVDSLITDWDGTTGSIARETAQAIGSIHDDLTSGDPYRVSHATTGITLFIASLGAGEASIPGRAGSIEALADSSVGAADLIRGGVYSLRNDVGEVVRTGRTRDLTVRQSAHFRDPVLRDLNFNVEYRTNVYAEQRGLEQVLYDRYPGARSANGGYNRIRAISPRNPNLESYIRAAEAFLAGL
jgi:RHS repeat-associated protein